MNLGFDLDEVVVDLTAELEKHLDINYGIEWPVNCFVNYNLVKCIFHRDDELNSRIIDDMLIIVNDAEFQFKAKPVEGAREVLQKLKKSGHKIHLVTSRPKQNQPLTFKWLRQNDIPFDTLDVIGHEDQKGFYGKRYRLDMYVDDLVKHLESMWAYKKSWRKGLVLMTKPWNTTHIDGTRFIRLDTWHDILRHVGVQNR